jgi:hypothetical protein
MEARAHRLRFRLTPYYSVAVIAFLVTAYRVHLLLTPSVQQQARDTQQQLQIPLHLNSNGAFTGDSECAFHFIWALAWTHATQSAFSSILTPPPSHCASFPQLYHVNAALQARVIIKSPASCSSILNLLVPLPSLPSPAAAGAYACWHLKYMARHFALMRRVAEAPSPVTAQYSSLPFNVSAVLHHLLPASRDAESKCERLHAQDKSHELRCCLVDGTCVQRHASQITWVAVPHLLRVFVTERQAALALVDANEVDENILLDTLENIKSSSAAHDDHETHKLWTTFVAMSMLLPHQRRLRSAQLDAALKKVTNGQIPGSEFAIFSEFSRCGSPTSVRCVALLPLYIFVACCLQQCAIVRYCIPSVLL